MALPFLAAACGDGDDAVIVDPPPEPAPAGALEVTAVVSGEDPDLGGYSVSLDDSESEQIGGVRDPDAVTFEGVTPGEHELELADATDNCEVVGANPRTVTVTEGRTASTTFEITCTRVEKIALLGDRHLDDIDVLVMHADGQDPFEVADGISPHGDELSFAWSPDGTEIAYQLSNGGIHLVDATGENERLLTGSRSFRPAWSPEGTRIAFQSDRTGDLDVWIVNADGSGETNLTADPDAVDRDPAWVPDGTRIVFERGGEIWRMAPDGSDAAPVVGPDFGVAANPAWSPDGSRIAFLGDDGADAWELWTVAPDGSNLRRLISQADLILDDVFSGFPRWSPDGTRIAIDGFFSVVSGLSVWVVEADGSNLRSVTAGRDPRWSPDGTRIVFVKGDGGIGIVDLDGSGARFIGRSILAPAGPAWRPRR